MCVTFYAVPWSNDSEISSRFICEHLLLLSREMQTSGRSGGISTALMGGVRRRGRDGGRGEKWARERTLKAAQKKKRERRY